MVDFPTKICVNLRNLRFFKLAYYQSPKEEIMIHTKQRLTQLFIALLTIIILTACGGSAAPQEAANKEVTTDENTVAATQVTTEEYDVEKVVEEPAAEEAMSESESIANFAPDGLVPPNDQHAADMFFEDYGVNPFIDTEDDNLSTFAIDVDTGAYTIMRRYLSDGVLPPDESVRVEEYINFFDQDYAIPQNEAFAIHLEGAPAPWYYGFYSTLIKSLNQIKYFQLKDGRGWHLYNKMEDAQTSLSASTPFQIIKKQPQRRYS
jgi:Ca-activated chloride channel family protein